MERIPFRYSLLLLLTALLACLPLASFASTATSNSILQVGTGSIKLDSFSAGYFIDSTESMPFDEVEKQAFTPSSNKISLGTKAKVTWVKMQVKNTNSTPIKLFLHHPYAYHNRGVDLYEVKDGNLIRSRILDNDDPDTNQWMFRGIAVFDFELEPEESRVLYVKSIAFSHQWITLLLLDANQSKHALQGSYTDIALMVGMLIALAIYNILLFISSRRKESLFYALYLVSGGIWISLTYGLLADLFNVYGSGTMRLHLTLMSMPIFLILFMMDVFETKQKHPIEHWALRFILALLCVEFVYGLFDIVGALRYASSLASLMMVITLSVGISLQLKKHPIARYFLLGHTLFVVFSGLAVMFYKGIAEFNYVNSHGVGIGIMLESLVLATIIAYRVKILENIKASQDELKVLASTDSMTQLYNRRSFYTEAEGVLALTKKAKQPISVAILDIDEFKKVNDNYGHSIGDKVIISVANSLKQLTRSKDIIARFGGEEFVILLPNTRGEDAFAIIEDIRIALGNKALLLDSNSSLNFTVSAGIADVDQDYEIEKALNLADKAMYEAKNNGRNQARLHKVE